MHYSLRNQLQEVFSASGGEEPVAPAPVVAAIDSGFKAVFEGAPEGTPPAEPAAEPAAEVVEKSEPKKEERFAVRKFDLNPPKLEETSVKKFNPHHGPDGRFTSAGGGAKWASFNRFELQMTDEQSRSASGPGRADEAVDALLQDAGIQKQLDQIDPQKIRDELYEYGAWDKEELADDKKNRARIVWIAAGNIADGN